MENKLKILIVDDHQILTDGIASMLLHEERLEVVGKMLDGKSALNFLITNQLDILITDLAMPNMSGFELTRTVKKMYPHIKILALSMSYDLAVVSELMDIGISGFVLKTIGRDELIDALKQIGDGRLYFSREVSNEMMLHLTKKNASETYHLTDREIEILKLLNDELSNNEIAKKLSISERTVETHRKNIYRKTNTKTIVGLMKYAKEKRYI